tara:strand:- start:719 stop:904 length:186 start_codon:yes stop_codon:yes gene_type:complete
MSIIRLSNLFRRKMNKFILILFIIVFITACGGGGSAAAPGSSPASGPSGIISSQVDPVQST